MDKLGLRDALPQPQQSDTRNDPFWGNLDSSLSAAAAAPPQSAQPTAKRDLDVGLGDVARGVGAGALELVGGIGELARQASNFGKENAGKQGGDYLEQARANMANKLSPVLDAVAGAGDLAQGGAESLTEGMSADAKEALGRRLVDETPEGRLTLGDGAGDIDVWAMKMAQGVGSLLPTLAAGGVTGLAAKVSIGRAVTASMIKRGATQEVAEAVAAKAVSKIATGASVTTGVTGSVGSAGVNARDTVLGMSFDELAGSDTFRQAFTRIDQDQQTAHLSDEEKLGLAREETANLASRATMSDAKVWGAAAMGSMMGDAMLFKMLAGKAATGGVLKGAAKGAAGEGISETLEEGVQQYAVNESLNEVAAADIDPMKGVMSSAIEGGLIGMGAGGAVGAVGGARGGKHASQEDGVGTDPVSEPSAPVTEGAAGPAVDPNFASVPLEEGEQAPSASLAEGELNPLGPSASQFDELRDVPAYLRQDDTADRYKGMAADSEVQRALAGEFGQTVQELVASQMKAGDQGKSLYERAQAGELGLDPFAGNKSAQQVAMENQRLALPLKDVIFAGDANAKPKGEAVAAPGDHDDQQAGPGPQFRGGERTRWQSGQEGDVLPPEASSTKPAGELPGAVIEGEAREVGNELPHRNVVYGNDLRAEQQRAADLARRERELNNHPLQIGQSETIFAGGTPGADPRNSAYTPPRLSRDQVDTSMGEQSTRDPRSPVAQSIEQAGSATDSVFGPLKSLRITRKGKPFATEKEAAMASRKGQEMPVPLNGGGFGVAEIAEVEQVKAAATTQSSAPQLDDISVTNPNQPSDQPAASVSAETVPAPSATAGEASQLAPAIDTGYREVIPVKQPKTEVSNEPVTPVPAISSEGQRDQPGAGEPAAAGAGPAVAGLTDRAGSGDRADLAAPAPVPDGQQQNDPTLTAPATDAGAAVSGRIGEEELRDRDLLKEHGGHWKYRSAVGAGWFTANTKEAAIQRAEEAYRKAVSKGEPVPTRDERFAQADAELFSEMDRRYGKMSTPELEAEYQRLGGEVGDLQKSGSGEFNGNGGRRTGAAVSNEGARQVGEERLRLGVYMKMRRDRDTAWSGAKSQQIEPANDWRGAKSATDYHAAKRRLFSGEMEFSEFQAMSRSALDNAPSLRAELEKKTKQDLLDQMSRFNAARYKNDKKAVVVEAAYNQLIGDLRWAANGDGNTISETYAIGGARQSIEERVAKALDGLTPERYQQFVNKQRADVAKRDAELAATKEALRDPQTLEQFKTFLKYRSLDKLTPEQRARYEDLIAASNLDKRDQANEVKAATAVTPTASGDIIKTKHTKSGEDLFVVQMGDRVDRDTYNQINAHAKKLGGWYSSYKVGGAVPGFQFKDEAKATEFRGWLTGQGAASAAPSAEAAPTEVTEPAQTDSKSKQVETLRTRAKTLRDKATAALNAERKENTNKRMTEAANARANAESELHFAGLLDAIADGIESGEVTYLRNLANGTQLTELNHALSRSLWNLPPARREALTSQGMIERAEDDRERWSAKATPEMMAEGAQMPGMDYFARNLKDVATKMQGASGFKQAGAKIMALVNAAINRDSKTVSITDPELIAKLKAYTSGVSDYDAKAVKEQINGYSRLERMGITNHTELRAALRELARLQAVLKKQAVPRDPLAEKMVALKRKLVGNRNAFIDFFPTPESHAADLVTLAGIEPGMTVLEPSAGHGMLAEAARAAGAKVDAVELAVDLREILQAKGFGLVGGDFMDTTPAQSYDAVVMNPPFSNDMDIDHVRHAYDHLKPGGRLVAIVSATAGDRQNNKNKAFREWFDGLGGSEQAMPDGAFKTSLNPTDVRTKIFVIDKPANEVKPLLSPEGKRVTVATPKGQSVEVQYRVMEAADLVASHDFEGNLNHDYPQQLQPRDRSKQTYRVQVGQIAAAPDGARLAASPETDRGAPIVRDGIVESGNGRTIGLKQAYQRGDAGAYRAYLLTHATEFGLDAAAIEAMSAPVLVRERLTEMDDQQLRDFVVDSNTDAKMANSAAEDAGADAGKLTDDMLDLLNIPEGGDVLASQNNRFLQAFLSAIGENQSNSYVSRDGQWNDAYRKRVTAAIFAYGYGNQRLLDAATGEVDADGRNITTALINNAVGMAKLRQHSPERAKVISNYLAEAVESIARAKRSGQSLQEMAAQSDMLGGDTSPEGSLLAQAIAASARSAKAITGMVGDILTMLNKTTSADMFGAAVDPATPETAINETLKAISAYNQQKASQPKPGGDLFGLAGARNNHGAAPSVPRSGDASAAKGAGGVTEGRLELDGVSIRIPAIDEEQQRLYNQATHRGQGVNFASGISTGVGRILNDLKDAGLLDTVEQRAAAEAEVQAWANEEAINARKLMRDGIKNPSWAITGRSGRKAQSSDAQDAENRRQAAHHKDQSDRITALRGELKKLRPKEVIGKDSFNYAWGKAKGMIADYASAQSNGQPNLLASLRKSMNAELARYLQSMGKIDAPNFIKTLKEQDQRLKAAGHDGLVAIVGARSNPGKIISNAIDGRIRFSKQAMSQGMRPAKHLTRKEAELVTKGWFKQYRGASGIDVQIHATQAELEESLGLDAKDGLIRRAAFDDDAGTLHVAADTISDPKRMREILRHEVLAHYGLANVLGDGEYTKLMSRLIQSQKDPSMKPVWDWVNTHYADEDIGTKAEEVVAHLAELEQGAWGRGWDRVVAWVTRALRAVGFVPDGITAAETRSLIEGLGKKLQRSGPDDSGPDGGKKFSQEAERPALKGGIKMSQASTAADAAMEKLNLGPKPDIIDKTKTNLNKLRQVDRGVVSSWVDRVIKKANTEVLDALAPIKYAEEAAGITDAADSGYVAARMATGAASTMQATMLYGLPEWKDGVIQRKAGTGEKDALLGIFADLGADLHNWLGWMAGHRAELLLAQGRENLLDAQDIAALKAQGKGKEAKFLDAKARWNRLNAATLDLGQEAGLFTKEARAEFESEWYIPFFRESDDGDVIAPFKTKGIANQNAGIKKLKGGEANTNDLLENIFTSTSKLIDASMKNMAAQKTVWNLADTGIIEVIPKPNKMDYQALANGKDRIMVKLEGEDYMIRVEDPDLYRAMTFFDRKPFGAMVNVAAKAKRLLTAGVTASPEFMLRNFLRDSLSSWAISKDGFRPVIDSIKGVKKTLAMDGSTIDVMFSGASFLGGYVNGNDPEAMADTVRKSLRRKGMTPEQIARYEKSIIRNAAQAKGVVANVWEKYNRYGEAFENANREAVYAAAIKAGKSHAQAAFESKDLMDFSMLGASRTMQVMTQLLPFFNARVQGLGKLSRELRDNPREIAKRAGMITAASLALLALNWDDERYEKLPDWDKDANWHFWIGDEEFRIPKPFEIGVLFGTIPERMVRAMGGKDTGAQLGKAIARAVGETFALNPTPQIVKPLVESYFNYDAFRGIPIENAQDLAVQAEARYNEQTSLMMRELGETLGMSPKKLEHLLIGYTGTIGSYVMAAADGLIRAGTPGESASWRADEIPLVKAVYRGTGPAKSTQHMEEFYRMLNEVNQLKRTVDQYRSEGLTDKARELLEEQGGILKSRRSLSRTQQQVRVVRNKIELIQRDRTMTAEEKRRRIDEMLARRNDLVYQAVNKNKANWE
ncbi:LPD38 domain-containing protein [Aeromonas hydrophila]|uniref:LPD38 domain-containing protein n=1 Tax=Aeromonas hydrophila TaxID=644 RepID=UPI000A7DF79B|nr:LPD38 domain-containing protein [Aeromonas hydrophila]